MVSLTIDLFVHAYYHLW